MFNATKYYEGKRDGEEQIIVKSIGLNTRSLKDLS